MALKLDAASLQREAQHIISSIKQAATDASHRVALAQIRLLQGDYPKALQQLQVACMNDPEWVPLAQLVKMLVQCEAARQAVFQGKIQADLLAPAPQWLEMMMQALKNEGLASAAVALLREQALALAPETAGSLNHAHAFSWLADGDERLGPALEVYADGRYFWLPFEQITAVAIEPHGHVLDLLWLRATITTPFTPTGKLAAYLPVRYPCRAVGDQDSTYETEWVKGQTEQGWQGKGVRVWFLDEESTPMRNVSSLTFRSAH